MPADTRSKGYDGLLASAHYRKKQYQRAVASFKRELPKAESKSERLAILGGLLDCYVKLHETEAAEEIYETLSEEAVDDQPALASIASYLYHKGETDRAHALFRDLTQDNPQGVVCLEYADLLVKEKCWPEAADLLAPFVDKDAPIWLRERYAVAAFNANQFTHVLDLLEEWETSPEDSRTLTELELELRLRAFDFTRVVFLAKTLLELAPDRHSHNLTLIQAQVGLGAYDAARTAIEQLDPVALKEEPATLVWLARLAQALKIPKALEFAWEAVRAVPDDHGTFADYFSICVSDTTLQEKDVVALDTTVTLRLASGEEITKTLLTRRDLKERELDVESPTGKALLGKHVGDNVPWGHGLSGVQYADVIKIRSKYVARFQDTDPNSLPTDTPRVLRLEATPESISELRENLKPQNDAVDELLRAYQNQNTFPVYGLVIALEESLLQVRSRLRSLKIALKSFDATSIFVPDKQHPHQPVWKAVDDLRYQRAQHYDKVVIDETGLLSLAELDQLDLLTRRFAEVFVPRSLLLSFEDYLLRQSNKMLASQTPRERAVVEKVVAWVRANAKIVTSYPCLSWQAKESNLLEIVPPHILDVLLTAEENDLLLFTDDVGLSRLWSGQTRRPTTNTRHLLSDAVVRDHLSPLEYTKLLVKLIEDGHGFVAFNAVHLALLFEKTGVSQSFKILAGQFGMPDVEVGSALRVALGFFLHLVRLCPRVLIERTHAVHCVLDALAQKANPEDLASWLKDMFSNLRPELAFSEFLFQKQVQLWLSRAKPYQVTAGDGIWE